MRTSPIAFALVLGAFGATAIAQDGRLGDPLSAIDWLGDAAPLGAAPTTPTVQLRPRDEPPVADSATSPGVETHNLDAPNPAAAGLLPGSVTGLPVTLWQGSDAARLSDLVRATPLPVPAMSALMTMLVLAEAEPPGNAESGLDFLSARIDRLMDLGAVDQAQALIDRAGARHPALFDRWAQISLLAGDPSPPCATLAAAPHLSRNTALGIFCTARGGDWNRAALVLQTARALGDLSERRATLMALFLDPELAEVIEVPPPPARPSPLEFRLYEALGEPLPTAPLPHAFAVLDLGGDNGWKAQIASAERLARTGALPANRLLGVYTLRKPPASGGSWDRVAAFQKFETVLERGPACARSRALESLWPQMRSARLLVPMADLFADRMAERSFEGRAERMAQRLAFLSPGYESLGPAAGANDPEAAFLSAIARGEAPADPGPLPHADAIAAAFAGAQPPEILRDQLSQGRLGEVILRAMSLFASGADGNPGDLTDALATLRAVGLEDVARRAALQLTILSAERSVR